MADLMTIQSAPYYWLVCDSCGRRDNSDYSAWSSPEDAVTVAEDSGWKVTNDGKHLCINCELHVCRECDTLDMTELAGERDYLCVDCWQKLPEEERV